MHRNQSFVDSFDGFNRYGLVFGRMLLIGVRLKVLDCDVPDGFEDDAKLIVKVRELCCGCGNLEVKLSLVDLSIVSGNKCVHTEIALPTSIS